MKSQGEESEGMDRKCRVYCFVAKQRLIKKLKLSCSLQTTQSHARSSLFVAVVVRLFVFFTGFLYLLVYIPKK